MRFLSCFLVVTSALAQTNIFLLPNASSETPTINTFRVNPFFETQAFPAQREASFFFVNAAGTKFYSVAAAAVDTVVVLSAPSAANVLMRHSLSPAEAAAMTPDRRRLLVVANGLHIIDTATDNVLATVTDVGTQPMDVAVSLDASRAFVLSAASNRLTAVDLTTNATVGIPITFPGLCTSVTVGPNGLVYVTAANRLYEIDGRFMTVRTEIQFDARPGKMVFTPDGRFGLIANQTPFGPSSIILIDLLRRQVAGTIPSFLVTLDTLTVASNNRVYAVSKQRQALYEISVTPLTINPPEFVTFSVLTNVFAVTATNEWPTSTFLFVGTSGSLRAFDNSTFPPRSAGSAGIPTVPGKGLVSATPAITGTPSQIVGYNNNEVAAVGTVHPPLVVRVFNSIGQPLQGVTVSFVSDNPAVLIQNGLTETNTDGYAVANVVAPTRASAFNVVATAGVGTTAPSFMFTLATASGVSSDMLTIQSGQGQAVQEQFQIREPLVVQVRDSQGRPAVNRPITFAIRSGTGTFSTSAPDGTNLAGVNCILNVCTVQSDANGRAAIGFITAAIASGSSFSQQLISATNGSSSVTFTVTSLLNLLASGGLASPPVVQRSAPPGNVISGNVGTTLREAIRVRVSVVSGPEAGQGIPGLSLRAFTGFQPATGPTVSCGDFFTDAFGVATCNLALGPTGGIAPLDISVGSSLSLGGSPISVDVRGGPPVATNAAFSTQGPTRTFTFNVFHPDGLSRLGVINLLMNSSLDARNACYLAYSVPQRVLYLVNDGGPTGGLSPGLPIGSPNIGSVANTQCRISAEGSSAVANGNILTLTFNASFNTNFAGSKVIYLAARTTDELTQGWSPIGVHEVPIPNPTFPNSSITNPGAGTTATTLMTFTYRDAVSTTNLQTLWGLTNSALDARGACYFAYHAPSNSLFLFPDSGDGTQAASMSLTGSDSLENSQCRINATGSDVIRSANSLTLILNITYKTAFGGTRIIWTAASTLTNAVSPWKASGAWRVPFF